MGCKWERSGDGFAVATFEACQTSNTKMSAQSYKLQTQKAVLRLTFPDISANNESSRLMPCVLLFDGGAFVVGCCSHRFDCMTLDEELPCAPLLLLPLLPPPNPDEPNSISSDILWPAGRGIFEVTELGLLLFDVCDGTLAIAFDIVLPCFDNLDSLGLG